MTEIYWAIFELAFCIIFLLNSHIISVIELPKDGQNKMVEKNDFCQDENLVSDTLHTQPS